MALISRHALVNVFKIIDGGDLNKIIFSVPSKSTESVVTVFAETETPKSLVEATRYIFRGIKSIGNDDFVERQCLFDDPTCIADVYGIIFENRSWYVKFYIDEEIYLEQVSFHPPEWEMKTVSGKLVPKGEFVYEKMRRMWIKRNN